MSAVRRILCTRQHGPWHGCYECHAHMQVEWWWEGRLFGTLTLEQGHPEAIRLVSRAISDAILRNLFARQP